MTETQLESLDLIWGATAISVVIARTPRQTFHMLESGELPAKKIGGRWVISRKVLRGIFEGETA